MFANGIWALMVMSGALFRGRRQHQQLIPLFAIGVFTGFTLPKRARVHWWKQRPSGWRRRAAVNGLGALLTAVTTVVFLISKFIEGAWVVVVAVPSFVLLFLAYPRLLPKGRT